MIRNATNQVIGAQLIGRLDGSNFSGTVTVYVTIDGGTQTLGATGSGLCTNEGRGYYTYRPTTAETDGNLIAFTFTGTDAVSATIQVVPETLLQQAAAGAAATPGSITAGDLCTRIQIRLGVIQAGEVPNPEDQQLTLDTLNTYIDGLATESLTMFDVEPTTFTLTAGTSTYTIGPGGAINMQRPVSPQAIDRINFIDPANTPTVERYLQPLTTQAYEGLIIKTQASPYPSNWYYNASFGSAALGTLVFWPVQTQTLMGKIYLLQAVTQLTLSTVISLPPGYRRYLETNVAVECAPAFSITPTPELRMAANESKANIKRVNARMMDLSLDPALTGRTKLTYNIQTDH